MLVTPSLRTDCANCEFVANFGHYSVPPDDEKAGCESSGSMMVESV
jgi:hypothetical protein